MTLESIRRTSTRRWYERLTDGPECDWGEVLVREPPARVVLSWRIGGDRTIDPDPAHAGEIDVRFVEEGPRSTRVELEHRGFERYGETAAKVRDGVSSDGGHGGLLELFAEKAAA